MGYIPWGHKEPDATEGTEQASTHAVSQTSISPTSTGRVAVVIQSLSLVDSLPHGLQHARPPCLSPTPRVDSNSGPLSQ